MNQETCLEIQALVDGELAPARRAAIDQLLTANPDARALHSALTGVRSALTAHELSYAVPETREFYWSQIQRRIATQESISGRTDPTASPLLGFLRWLVPAAGVAVLAMVLVVPAQRNTGTVLAAVDNVSASPSSVVYRSDAQGVTVHWIN